MEVTVDQALGILRAEEERLRDVTRRIDQAISVVGELKLVKATLESMDGEETSLIPIGGGVYLPAKVTGEKKFLVNIGSGVAVEKSREEVIRYLDNRIGLFEKLVSDLSKEADRISRNIDAIKQKIEEVVRNQQGPAVVG